MRFWNLSKQWRVAFGTVIIFIVAAVVAVVYINYPTSVPPPDMGALPPAAKAEPPMDVSGLPTAAPVKRPASCPTTNLAGRNGAWVVPWLEDPNKPDLVPAQAQGLGLVDFFWLAMGPTPGAILQQPDNPEVRPLDTALAAAQSGSACSLRFVTVVDNYTGGQDPATTKAWLANIVLNKDAREQQVRALAIEMAKHPLADGLTADYEFTLPDWKDLGIYAKAGHLESLLPDNSAELVDRISSGYTRFMEDLAAAMHRQGRQLRVAVAARTDSQLTKDSYLPNYIADYGAIATAADQLDLMTYDYHYESDTNTGPIAPLDWIKQVQANAATYNIPAGKLAFALPLYAYNWPVDSAGKVAHAATNLTPTEMAATNWPKTGGQDGETHYTYRDSQGLHEVWDSATGLAVKTAAIRQLCGCSVMAWKVGNSDPVGSRLVLSALH